MKITDKWINDNNPCKEALEWWDKKERNSIKILELLIKDKKINWANWFIVHIMTYKQYVSYAVFAAEQVIDIYEKKYPDDKKPREAIETAKKCIKNPSKENRDAAAYATYAAANAADNAANNAANAATYAAAYAAYAADNAADAAANAADNAANAAAYAAYAAAYAADNAANAAANAADAAMKIKILQYGISLLKEGA